MSTHLYAFGSICRGEIDESSDIDLLACLSEPTPGIGPDRFSVYSDKRIRELWAEGNPFAWHLHLESKLLYSSDGNDFIHDLGLPTCYSNVMDDCAKFRSLFLESVRSLTTATNSPTFDISCMFLSARNFATCHSLASGVPLFSRYSPLLLEDRLPISKEDFDIYVRARILSTRGLGAALSRDDIDRAKKSAHAVVKWMNQLASRYSLPEPCSERI